MSLSHAQIIDVWSIDKEFILKLIKNVLNVVNFLIFEIKKPLPLEWYANDEVRCNK